MSINIVHVVSKTCDKMSNQQIKVTFWNVNTDRRCQLEKGYANWCITFKLDQRIDSIFEQIKNQNPDVCALFEIDINSLEIIKSRMKELGYLVTFGAYAPNQDPDYSFYFVTGYKSDVLTVVNSYMFWFTSTPKVGLTSETRKTDGVLSECNESYEKGSLVTIFKTHAGDILIVSANHFGLRYPYQKKSAKLLSDHLFEIKKEYREQSKVSVVIGGDFNMFPQFDGQQISPFVKKGFKQFIDENTTTFCGYPYDLGLKGRDYLKDVIEKTQGLQSINEKIGVFVNKVLELHGGPITSVLDCAFVDTIMICNYEVDKCGIDVNEIDSLFTKQTETGVPFMPSDHFPIIVTLS